MKSNPPSSVSLVPLSFTKHKLKKSKQANSSTKRRRTVTRLSPLASPLRVSMGDFSPPFDVISELSINRDEYVGNENFTLLRVPSFLRTCIDRVSARVISTSRPGLAITCACCITYGLQLISSHPDIKELIRLKEEVDLIDSVQMDDLEELASWFRSFPISVPTHSAYTSRRHNIFISEHLKLQLFDLASKIGTHATDIATLSIMVTMADQTNVVLREHSELLNQSVDTFLRRVRVRVRVGASLIEDTVSQGIEINNQEGKNKVRK